MKQTIKTCPQCGVITKYVWALGGHFDGEIVGCINCMGDLSNECMDCESKDTPLCDGE